jgi:hypothetical protein
VTRALALSWIPSLATASMVPRLFSGLGQSMTLGLTLVLTASKTSRPARSMAVARWKVRGMLALLAAIRALLTRITSPPAR